MTHLSGNLLVQKSHPRILFRGRLDALQASVVLAQTEISGRGGSEKLLEDLNDLLHALRMQRQQQKEANANAEQDQT